MHKAKNCIVTCIDFRLQKAYSDFIKSHNLLGESDMISLAGCSRDLVKPLEDFHKESLLRQIDLSVQLHDPDNIILLDHQDCGGYAQDGTIPQGLELDADKNEHQEWGKKAVRLLQQLYPEKAVTVYFVHLDGKVDKL